MDYTNLFTDRTRWRKDGAFDETGAMCLAMKLLADTSALLRCKDIILRLFPERVRTCVIPSFNDHPDTTFEDVQKVLRELQFEMDLHS